MNFIVVQTTTLKKEILPWLYKCIKHNLDIIQEFLL